MKRIFISIIIAFSCLVAVNAQDARQRTPETIVQDALAGLPAQTSNEFNTHMEDLAKVAPTSVEMLGAMLQPAEKGANNLVEYALSGLAYFASDPANTQYKENVKLGFESAIAKCTNFTNVEFLKAQLAFICPPAPKQCPQLTEKELLAKADELAASSESTKRCQSLWLYVQAQGAKSSKKILAALKDADRSYRTNALQAAASFADEKFYAQVLKLYPKLSEEAKLDVLDWLGDNKVTQSAELLAKEIAAGGELAVEAIAAASKIGGNLLETSLFTALENPELNMDALVGLMSFNGDIKPMLEEKFKAASLEDESLPSLLILAKERHMTALFPQVLKFTAADEREVSVEALRALTGTATVNEADILAENLEKAEKADVKYYERALLAALGYLTPAEQYAKVKSYIEKSSQPAIYYKALAKSSTNEAVKDLEAAYKNGSKPALEALATVDNYNARKAMFEAGKSEEKYLLRFVKLVEMSDRDRDKKVAEYVQALEVAKEKNYKAQKSILKTLSSAPTMRGFLIAGEYLADGNPYAYTAAQVAKTIATKTTDDIDYNDKNRILSKASEIFKAAGGADDGYAVDEIKKILAESKPSPKSELTAEEKAEGWEMLFDGTDLSKWTGDKVGYTVVNGTIYVSAEYGNNRNLYTINEYSDFVLRFEFCFLKQGINNGVGIRTPMGVDAAYHGMCEVQILDHDAPIYSKLKAHQVHGSVYGIKAAKRIVHKPLGEWSTQEIRVVGERVIVTVNGEVITDVNVREACQGNNVAPDGGKNNPYTVDGRNHPGLFNKKGHIGFLGHGTGLKLRNVRVLDLSKSK